MSLSFRLQKKNKHPAVVHPLSQRYIELRSSMPESTLHRISKMVMKEAVEDKKMELTRSGMKIPENDVDVLDLINTLELYGLINDGIDKHNHCYTVQGSIHDMVGNTNVPHSAVKKEHVMGVSCPVIVGYSNYESSMLLSCHDYVGSPSCLLGKKITGVLHQSTFKDMPSCLPTVSVNERIILLHPMTKFDDAILQYGIDRGNGQVAKIFDNYEEAIAWYREIVPGCDFDEDRNDCIQEVGSTESYVMVPRPVVSCDLMCKTDKDLLTYHNTQTPSASSNDDDSSSAPELVDRREDSDNDGNRADSDSDNIKQGTSLRVARVVMEQVVQDNKQELGRSGKEIPTKDVQVLALIKPEYFYASINDGIDKYKKGDDFVYNYKVDTYPHGKKSSSY